MVNRLRKSLETIPVGTSVLVGMQVLRIERWEWSQSGDAVRVYFEGRAHPGLYQGMPILNVVESQPGGRVGG